MIRQIAVFLLGFSATIFMTWVGGYNSFFVRGVDTATILFIAICTGVVFYLFSEDDE